LQLQFKIMIINNNPFGREANVNDEGKR